MDHTWPIITSLLHFTFWFSILLQNPKRNSGTNSKVRAAVSPHTTKKFLQMLAGCPKFNPNYDYSL